MQNLESLDAISLKAATLLAAKSEKEATHVLLAHLVEVDRRWLFAEWGYESLHVYIRDALGFSDHQAYERASAAKLLRKVPEVKEALESGRHTLTSAAKISSHVRREKATVEEASELLARCENLSTREIERVLVSDSTQVKPNPERVRAVSSELTRLTLEVDAEFMALVEKMKSLQQNPAVTLQEIFQLAMKEFAKRREPKPPRTAKTKNPNDENTPAPQKRSPSRHTPKAEEDAVRLRSEERCEFVAPETGKRCDARTTLQFDHYPIPFAVGGPSIAENLRRVCAVHNRLHAIQAYGAEKMAGFLETPSQRPSSR